jgi:phospholipid/cholesterol/gamma-HCH transport system permease protein
LIKDPLRPFRKVGKWGYFVRDIGRAFRDPATYGPETIRQMRNIGVDSVPLAAIVAAFIGAVTAVQTRYQLFGGVQLSVVGLISRQSIILELGPLLTGLVLTGRVGARITAEIGTMRVTEQIDALETLAYDPVAYLVVPRLIAALIMLPVLTILADAVGIGTAMITAMTATDVTSADFTAGLRLSFTPFQIV